MKQQITDQAAEVKNLPVTIDLGALELSLQDLLELRPGSVIELPGAKSLEGLLKVAGAPWWKVRLEPQAEQLKVCIEEFFR